MSHYFDFRNPLSICQRAAVSGIFDSPTAYPNSEFFEAGVLAYWLSLQDSTRVNESVAHFYQLDPLYTFYTAYREAADLNVQGRHAALLELFESGSPEGALRYLTDKIIPSQSFTLSTKDAESYSCLTRRVTDDADWHCKPAMALAAKSVCLHNTDLTPTASGRAYDGVLLYADVANNGEGFIFRCPERTNAEYIRTERVVSCGFHAANGYYIETEDRCRYLILTACINPILSIYSVADLLACKQKHIALNNVFFGPLRWG